MSHKNDIWVEYEKIAPESGGEGVVRRVLAYTDGVMCVENSFDTGAVGPMHSHPHTQLTYVAKGEFAFTVGNETRTVKQGDTLLKQNGIEHGCVCIQQGVLVDIFTPMRADFVVE